MERDTRQLTVSTSEMPLFLAAGCCLEVSGIKLADSLAEPKQSEEQGD